MTIQAIIFDLDGTIVDFNLDYKALRGDIQALLLRAGVPPSILPFNQGVFDMLQKAELYFKNNAKPERYTNVRVQSLAIAEKYEKEAANTTNLIPGALETLRTLKTHCLKIGLCTLNSKAATTYILNRFKINEYFQTVITREQVTQVKPDTHQLELTLNTLGVSADVTIVVGDSVLDMQSARELKIVAVGLLSAKGASTKEQLIESGANYLVTSLTDLPALIKKIEKA
ncbi:MAG: HAD family hydrolase [Nitrososphaerota archaeon]|jgi:HAD superfamily hydrolase (TIGR01549 family)|nr:HAD family hydrolase [Nitrososphaerota archaeon]